MTHDPGATDEIDITEAMRLSGLSRRTLMRYKETGRLKGRVETRSTTQRQRRVLFVRDEIEALARGDEG